MAGERMQAMPMAFPRQLPAKIGAVAVQWACTRRGRMILLTGLIITVLIGLTGVRHQEAIASNYNRVSTKLPWRPHVPKIPAIVPEHFKTPSNTTLQLENGDISHVPAKLKKTTPNFHLIMPSDSDSNEFCKSTLSAMLLKYPPPTVVNLHVKVETDEQREIETLNNTLQYLSNQKFVRDDDLVLVVDGQKSWFQLPSDVMIAQYKKMLEDGNARLLEKYGVDKGGYQKFNQTIVFGADKFCLNDDMACKYVPDSPLPHDLYGQDVGKRIAESPAKFLNAKMHMGPARDLRAMYQAAYKKLEENKSQSRTIQSAFATLFGEQQMKRDSTEKQENQKTPEDAKKTSRNTTQHEYSIGLDYTHMLFQPFIYCAEDELFALKHDSPKELLKYQRSDSWPQDLQLPAALFEAKPPYWRPDYVKHNPSPNVNKPAYIDKLDFAVELDRLPKRKVSWNTVQLLQNTYTGAVPAILLNNPLATLREDGHRAPAANVSWNDMWYTRHKRALLRSYFRTTQSPTGYHDALVGGDRAWDKRGGRGGIWAAEETVWHPWGEADGVCGAVNQINAVFGDGKGVWLHEKDEDGEEDRIAEIAELAKDREEQRKKLEDAEREKQAAKVKETEHLEELRKKKKEKEEKEKQEKENKQKQAEAKAKALEEEENKAKELKEKEKAKALAKAEEEKQRKEAEAKIKAIEEAKKEDSDPLDEAEKQRKEAEAKIAALEKITITATKNPSSPTADEEQEEKQRKEAEAKLKAFKEENEKAKEKAASLSEEEAKQRKEVEAKLKQIQDDQRQLETERAIQDQLAAAQFEGEGQPGGMSSMGKASLQGRK